MFWLGVAIGVAVGFVLGAHYTRSCLTEAQAVMDAATAKLNRAITQSVEINKKLDEFNARLDAR